MTADGTPHDMHRLPLHCASRLFKLCYEETNCVLSSSHSVKALHQLCLSGREPLPPHQARPAKHQRLLHQLHLRPFLKHIPYILLVFTCICPQQQQHIVCQAQAIGGLPGRPMTEHMCSYLTGVSVADTQYAMQGQHLCWWCLCSASHHVTHIHAILITSLRSHQIPSVSGCGASDLNLLHGQAIFL